MCRGRVRAAATDRPAAVFGRFDVGGQIEWLSTGDAADRLGINTRTLYRFIDTGEIPAYKFGRVFRVKAEDVDAFIEKSRVEPGSLEHLYTT